MEFISHNHDTSNITTFHNYTTLCCGSFATFRLAEGRTRRNTTSLSLCRDSIVVAAQHTKCMVCIIMILQHVCSAHTPLLLVVLLFGK